MFGIPEFIGARELAQEWVAEKIKKKRGRRCRNDTLLVVGTIAAIAAALFSGYALLT